MKFELPPPIPAKRASPTKVEPPGPPPIPPELLGEEAGPPSTPIPPPRNEASPSGKPLPAVSSPPVPSAPSTPAPSNEEAGKPAEASESAKRTGRSTPWLVVGFAVMALGLLIVWIGSSSPTQKVSSNSGSYSVPKNETPAVGSSPVPSPSVDEWERKLEDLRKRAEASFAAQSPTMDPDSIQPTAAPPQTYHVIKVKRGDQLKMHTGPGQTYPVVANVAPDARGILLLSERIANGSTIWQEISVGGYTGWVNEIYLEADFPRAVKVR